MRILTMMLIAVMLTVVNVVIASIPVYFLWNWLMPDIFGLREIDFLQAVGLCLLREVFFKSFITASTKEKS